MASLNKVFLAGNLTRDPEVRYLSSGTPKCSMGLAINDNYKTKDGELVERTVFVDVEVWGKQAELCREYLGKGSSALIEGKLELQQWEVKQGERQGEKRSKLVVRADRVQFIGRPRKQEFGDAPAAERPAKPAPAAPPPDEASPQGEEGGGSEDIPF